MLTGWARDRGLLALGRRMEREGFVVGTAGNLSVRTGKQAIRITPTRHDYAKTRRRDLVTVDLLSGESYGRRPPSRELRLHVEVYAARPDVAAVIHTHSVFATAWSLTGRALDPGIEDQEYYGVGSVPCVRYAPAGSTELARSVAAALGDGDAVLVARHGVVTVGPDLEAAWRTARVTERIARIACVAEGRLPRIAALRTISSPNVVSPSRWGHSSPAA